MTDTEKTKLTDREQLESLLPWYAAGTLSTDEARLVERAIESDAELKAQLDLIAEEQEAIIAEYEATDEPSEHAWNNLMAAIAAEEQIAEEQVKSQTASQARQAQAPWAIGAECRFVFRP